MLERELAAPTGTRRRLVLVGPAFVAALAYVDPGNFATNVSAGAQDGYLLLWVIVTANVMAMFVQSLSAKLGLATGMSLPENCRRHYRRPVVLGLWGQAELVAMATDLAEIVGGALALHLLFGLDLFTGGVLTGAMAFLLLVLHERGSRRYIGVMAACLGVIVVAFLVLALRAEIDPAEAAEGLVPRLDGIDSLVLAVGILGATVMPHAIYLHSALETETTRAWTAAQKRRALRSQRIDVTASMTLAGLVNVAMLLVAAALFAGTSVEGADAIGAAYEALREPLDDSSAEIFALALLVSGFASASAGTYAGQVVMQGFLRRRIPLFVRRAITMVPALAILGLGADPTWALVVSQVMLSFGIPFALVPLLQLTRRREVMGELVNRRRTTVVAGVVAGVIITLNVVLLVLLL